MWIKITERLPEKSGDYLVTTKNGYVCIAKFWRTIYKEPHWNGRFNNCVVAWMEAPKPYVEPGNEII